MSTDHIRYDLLAQNALRGVVKRVLQDAAREGLPGEHHFYVSFKTRFPGVKISQRLAEKYPEEITIVLQHQFWDLSVSDQGFEVGLSFGNAPEKLVVPFDAVCGFFDPSVQFGLKFEVAEQPAADAPEGAVPAAPANASPPAKPAFARPVPAPRADGAASRAGGKTDAKPEAKADSKLAAKPDAKADAGAPKPLKVVPAADEAPVPEGEKVVSLDTFRKKK